MKEQIQCSKRKKKRWGLRKKLLLTYSRYDQVIIIIIIIIIITIITIIIITIIIAVIIIKISIIIYCICLKEGKLFNTLYVII